jgi:hypothetical protein
MPTLERLRVPKNQASDWQRVASLPDDEFEAALAQGASTSDMVEMGRGRRTRRDAQPAMVGACDHRGAGKVSASRHLRKVPSPRKKWKVKTGNSSRAPAPGVLLPSRPPTGFLSMNYGCGRPGEAL